MPFQEPLRPLPVGVPGVCQLSINHRQYRFFILNSVKEDVKGVYNLPQGDVATFRGLITGMFHLEELDGDA
jgi:hypothetical protein